MGIVNVTPDSFADGGTHYDAQVAIAGALRMVAEGADLIDIGGESTRPGAPALSADEEWRRIGPVFEGLAGRIDVPLSVDTYKAEVATRAIDQGATIINDISAFEYDPALADVAARHGAAVILMHNRGRSADMYARANYDDVVGEVGRELRARIVTAERAGIAANRIVIDPGLGFAKRAAHSLAILSGLSTLADLGYPMLVGPSLKSFLQAGLGSVPPESRLWGTAAAVTAAILLGAHIVRVHDVVEMVQVARVADALLAGGGPSPDAGRHASVGPAL